MAFWTNVLTVLPYVEALGIVSFCISGFIQARKRHFDPVGIFVIGFVTAFGGGTLRDLLLNHRPFYWEAHHLYLVGMFFFSFFSYRVLGVMDKLFARRALEVTDAMGLGLFTVSSTALALDQGLPWFVASIYGVIGAAFGGVMRDVLCGETPMLLSDPRPYATCAFTGAWVYIALSGLGFPSLFNVLVGSIWVVVLRLASLTFKWKLPKGI